MELPEYFKTYPFKSQIPFVLIENIPPQYQFIEVGSSNTTVYRFLALAWDVSLDSTYVLGQNLQTGELDVARKPGALTDSRPWEVGRYMELEWVKEWLAANMQLVYDLGRHTLVQDLDLKDKHAVPITSDASILGWIRQLVMNHAELVLSIQFHFGRLTIQQCQTCLDAGVHETFGVGNYQMYSSRLISNDVHLGVFFIVRVSFSREEAMIPMVRDVSNLAHNISQNVLRN